MNGRKGMSEFIGYTFKRESEPSVAEVITSPQSLIDPVMIKIYLINKSVVCLLLIFVTIILNVRDELLLARGEAGLLFANDQF